MWAKLLKWLPVNITAILGILQAIIKFCKEVCTLLLDIIAPLIPGTGDDTAIAKVRDFFNMLDGWIQKVKDFLLGLNGS